MWKHLSNHWNVWVAVRVLCESDLKLSVFCAINVSFNFMANPRIRIGFDNYKKTRCLPVCICAHTESDCILLFVCSIITFFLHKSYANERTQAEKKVVLWITKGRERAKKTRAAATTIRRRKQEFTRNKTSDSIIKSIFERTDISLPFAKIVFSFIIPSANRSRSIVDIRRTHTRHTDLI